jgi:hypothetical protein
MFKRFLVATDLSPALNISSMYSTKSTVGVWRQWKTRCDNAVKSG